MKGMRTILGWLIMLLFVQSGIAGTGLLFNVVASGTPASVNIILCLDGKGPLSCQNYHVSAVNLKINTLINHTYPTAGIKVLTSGYTPKNCTPISNRFCLFAVSETAPAMIQLISTSQKKNQTIKFTSKPPSSAKVGGTYKPTAKASSGLPVTITVDASSTNVCSKSGATITFNAVGTCILDANQTGNSNFKPAPQVQQVITVAGTPHRASVGTYINSTGGFFPLSYTSTNGGSTWKVSANLPLPADATFNYNFLYSVGCDSKNNHCSTVGFYQNTASTVLPLAYTSSDGGVTWTLSPLTLPSDSSGFGYLNSNICNSTGLRCNAIGNYNNPGISPLSYTSRNGGVTWTASTPLIMPSDYSGAFTQLISVSCNSTGNRCNTVGFYENTSNSAVPLSYTSTDGGVTWSLSSMPLPADIGSNQFLQVSSVSCGSSRHCSAVGSYFNTAFGISPVSYSSSNGGVTWTLRPLGLPADVNPKRVNQDTELNAINCDNTDHCNAVGFYFNNASSFVPLSYTSSDGGVTWTVSATKLPLPADVNPVLNLQNSYLFGITCSSNHFCSAIGQYNNNVSAIAPLSYSSSNGGITWTVNASTLPLPADVYPTSALRNSPLFSVK